MKYLKLFENYNYDDIVFVRYNMYDTSSTKRNLPYEGRQCWAISKDDLPKYLQGMKLANTNLDEIEIIKPTSDQKISALDFNKADSYVLGLSDDLPKLEKFDIDKHTLKYYKVSDKEKIDQLKYYDIVAPDYYPINPYQIFLV